MQKSIIEDYLKKYQSLSIPETPHAAAVLVMIMDDEDGDIFILLTKRASSLANYAGDYSFPGGIHEASDLDFQHTAQREVKEELNIDENQYEIIGKLDDFLDRHGNLVRVYVATINRSTFEIHYQKSNDEIDSIYYFPIEELNKIEPNTSLENITKRRPSYCYIHNDVVVWGLTASILVHLSNIILNLNRPVGNFLIKRP